VLALTGNARSAPGAQKAFGRWLTARANDIATTVPSAVGWGLVLVLAAAVLYFGVRPIRHGVAAGVLNTFRWTGLALGIALMGAVVSSAGRATATRRATFVHGFSHAVTINAAIAALAAAVALLTLRGHPPSRRRRRRSKNATAPRTLSVSHAHAPG
jgi:hypothetical protein